MGIWGYDGDSDCLWVESFYRVGVGKGERMGDVGLGGGRCGKGWERYFAIKNVGSTNSCFYGLELKRGGGRRGGR